MPTHLTIIHDTTYAYTRPVTVNPHRLMVRPREGFGLRLHAFDLQLDPGATVSWAEDASGTAVATVAFAGPMTELRLRCCSRVEVMATPFPVFDISASAISYPFSYPPEDEPDLAALRHRPADAAIADWARAFVASTPTDTLSLLKDLNAWPSSAFRYEARDDEGTQSPAETIRLNAGTCRDYAELFTQAARSLGFASRVVSGYLYDAQAPGAAVRGAASSHAWSDVYLPGAGWVAFDPTNGTTGGASLIPVAVGSRMERLVPVAGSFDGPPEAFKGMSVHVEVRATPAGSPAIADRP